MPRLSRREREMRQHGTLRRNMSSWGEMIDSSLLNLIEVDYKRDLSIDYATMNVGPFANEQPGVDEAHDLSQKVEAFPPLPTGQSSPCSPLEFDEGTRKRPVVLKKAVNFVVVERSEGNLTGGVTNTSVIVPIPLPQQSPLDSAVKKRVSFARTVLHKEVRHINDFTKEEVETLWMTLPDYLMIKAVVKSTVAMMMKGESMVSEEWCARGLEARTRTGAKERNCAKLRTRSAVLNEQDMQREEGFEDPEFIAMACMEASEASRACARARGTQDELSVQHYLADVRPMSAIYQQRSHSAGAL